MVLLAVPKNILGALVTASEREPNQKVNFAQFTPFDRGGEPRKMD